MGLYFLSGERAKMAARYRYAAASPDSGLGITKRYVVFLVWSVCAFRDIIPENIVSLYLYNDNKGFLFYSILF